jgi:hypothetical protein
VFVVLCPFANQFCVPKAKDGLECEIRAKKQNDQNQPNDHERRVNALSYSHAKAIDATSDVTKPVNSRKRLTRADPSRQIGAERPRQKWLRARAIVETPNPAAMSLDASYKTCPVVRTPFLDYQSVRVGPGLRTSEGRPDIVWQVGPCEAALDRRVWLKIRDKP